MTSEPAGPVALARDCVGVTVPAGTRIVLGAGTEVAVLHRLGSSVTVQTSEGGLVRLGGSDFDALGLDASERNVTVSGAGRPATFDMARVTEALATVYDPEIPVSIVDLGLVYRCDEQVRPDGTRKVEIDMSMTAPGCGMGEVLCDDARRVVSEVPGVDEVEVNLVFDPPWGIDRMSDEVRLELGLL